MNAADMRCMAAVVRAIHAGQWTDDLPYWVPVRDRLFLQQKHLENSTYLRAVLTAEVFTAVLIARYPDYDEREFLRACGLVS